MAGETVKDRVTELIVELEQQVEEYKILNNRLHSEIKQLKQRYSQLMDIVEEGAKICHLLKTSQ